jgi:hypothetical protein
MASKDPFQVTGRWRFTVFPLVFAAALLTVGTMGVVHPLQRLTTADDLRSAIVSDYYRIEHAALAYVEDNGEYPAAAFNLSDGYDGGLRRRASAPVRHQKTWSGPYLDTLSLRPTRHSFWSLAEPQSLRDADADGLPDELWTRLNRGNGEIDDETAAWLDRSLDDGRADAGKVRVTPTWIWFELAEH